MIRVVLAEALLLSLLGGAGGLALAEILARWLRNTRLDFGLPVLLDVRLDGRVVLFTLLVSVASGLLFGLLPAFRATRSNLSESLRAETTSTLGARRRFGVTGALVAGQVAVSILLLAVAGIFLESLGRARGADAGFNWERTAYVQVNAAPLGLGDEATTLLFDQIEERMEALPGIGRVTRSVMLPAAQFGSTTLLLGSGIGGVDAPTEIPWNFVSLDYFEVLNVPLLHGRLFRDSDLSGPTVAVVSEALAKTYWGRSDIVGETYRSEGSPDELREIIGVVGDATVRSLGEPVTPSIYWPLNIVLARQNFIFEFEGTSAAALAAAGSAVSEIDSRIMRLRAATMEEHLGQTLQRQRLAGSMVGGLGLMALILAVLGVYGVVSFAVSRRRQEVGIRIALGADRGSVVRLFLRDVSAVVLAGAVVGLLLSIPVGTLVGRMFTGGTPNPLTTLGVALLLLLSSVIATVIPAARAARTDPTHALRQE